RLISSSLVMPYWARTRSACSYSMGSGSVRWSSSATSDSPAARSISTTCRRATCIAHRPFPLVLIRARRAHARTTDRPGLPSTRGVLHRVPGPGTLHSTRRLPLAGSLEVGDEEGLQAGQFADERRRRERAHETPMGGRVARMTPVGHDTFPG